MYKGGKYSVAQLLFVELFAVMAIIIVMFVAAAAVVVGRSNYVKTWLQFHGVVEGNFKFVEIETNKKKGTTIACHALANIAFDNW